MENRNAEKYIERIRLVDDAIALKETKRIPICPQIGALPYVLGKSSYRAAMYDYPEAAQALVDFYQEFQLDATTHTGFVSGKANELARSAMIDWPGRPGSHVPEFSTYEVIEHEYMTEEEYPEFLKNFTGFLMRKYIPRAFPALKGLENLCFNPSIILNSSFLSPLYSEEVQRSFELIGKIGEEERKARKAADDVSEKLREQGFPPMVTGVGEAPFDIIGDYFRGTLATLTDQIERTGELAEACDRMADLQLESWQDFRNTEMTVTRVYFPLHKGMDGFMSGEQYRKIYWEPLKKCIMALINMGVTPIIYTEGKYNTRLEYLAEVPKGKVLYHFETVDIRRAKEVLGGTAAISGNLPIYLMEYGTPEQVREETKKLLDICVPGGGYIFDFNACIDLAKRENMEILLDTIRSF